MTNFWKNQNSNWFAENPQNINRKWRPKKWISLINQRLKEKGFEPAKKHEIEEIYLQLINLPEDQLKKLLTDKKQPMLVRIVVRNMLDSKRGFDIIEKILDRGIGRAVNTFANPDGTPLLWDFKINIIKNDNTD